MKNITVSVSDSAYRGARIWAAAHGTSVSRIVAYMLETLPSIKRLERAFPDASRKKDACESVNLSISNT